MAGRQAEMCVSSLVEIATYFSRDLTGVATVVLAQKAKVTVMVITSVRQA